MKFNYHLKSRNSYTYKAYREYIDVLHAQDKTTGNNHSEAMLAYSKMNVTRMKRLDKTALIRQDLAEVILSLTNQKWLILTEAWCGDAAQNIHWINKMAALNSAIQVQLILRDENTDIMHDYQTNGGNSIPKLIALSRLSMVSRDSKHCSREMSRIEISVLHILELDSKTIPLELLPTCQLKKMPNFKQRPKWREKTF